jgi:hypothetical protein
MVGAHCFGNAPNHFGVANGVNAWIAELGDSLPAIGLFEPSPTLQFELFPNPAQNFQSVSLRFPKDVSGEIVLTDILGRTHHRIVFKGKTSELAIDGIQSGMYFVNVFVKGKKYETKKLIIRN